MGVDTHSLGSKGVWHGNENLGRCGARPRRGRAVRKGAEVHGVDLEYVQNPWLGPGLWGRIQRQLGAQRGFVIGGELPDDEFVVSAMPVVVDYAVRVFSLASSHHPPRTTNHLRDQPVVPPAGDAQDGTLMSLPHGAGPHDGEIPSHHEAVCIAGQEPLVSPDEDGSMHLGLVAAQNRLGLRGSPVGCHCCGRGGDVDQSQGWGTGTGSMAVRAVMDWRLNMQCRSKTKMICEVPSRRSKLQGPLQAPPLSSDYCSDRQELTAARRRLWGSPQSPTEPQTPGSTPWPELGSFICISTLPLCRSAAACEPASSSTDAWQHPEHPTTPQSPSLGLPRAVPLGQPVTQHHLRVGFSHLQPHGSGRGRACRIHGCRIIMGCQWRLGRLIGLLGCVDGSFFVLSVLV